MSVCCCCCVRIVFGCNAGLCRVTVWLGRCFSGSGVRHKLQTPDHASRIRLPHRSALCTWAPRVIGRADAVYHHATRGKYNSTTQPLEKVMQINGTGSPDDGCWLMSLSIVVREKQRLLSLRALHPERTFTSLSLFLSLSLSFGLRPWWWRGKRR